LKLAFWGELASFKDITRKKKKPLYIGNTTRLTIPFCMGRFFELLFGIEPNLSIHLCNIMTVQFETGMFNLFPFRNPWKTKIKTNKNYLRNTIRPTVPIETGIFDEFERHHRKTQKNTKAPPIDPQYNHIDIPF